MKSRLMLILTLLPAVAVAQDPADLELSGGYAQISETLVDDPSLNVQACFAETAAPITVDVGYTGTDLFLEEAILRVWLETSSDTDCVGQVPANGTDDYIGDVDLPTDDAFLTSGVLIRIPDDLEDDAGAVPVLDTQLFFDRYTACPEGANSTLTLCIGLDSDKDGSIDDDTLNFEPHGWVRYDVDTERPPQPNTPTARGLDGRVRVSVSVPSDGTADDDIDEYFGAMRPQPEDPDLQGVPCDEWEVEPRTKTFNVALGATSATFDISGSNGVTYEVCVYAIDDAGNFSEPSDLATATPREECDFIECYPDGLLEPGCRAAGPTPFAGLCLLLLALRRALEKRA